MKLAKDRFHPGEGLYREWSNRIAQQIAIAVRGKSQRDFSQKLSNPLRFNRI
jgi:hypothetical protein